MKVTSSGIVDGIINDKYGKRGIVNDHGIPTCSIPLKIEDAPENTVSYAIVIEDKDAIPVSGGFSWIHWIVANITRGELKENESQLSFDFVQGVNSWISIQGGEKDKEICTYYGGMAPLDSPHIYEIHVYAIDTMVLRQYLGHKKSNFFYATPLANNSH
ncbi:YbhB/YbcL family Raf kinase inhibitor-like protein [Clostridium carnis]